MPQKKRKTVLIHEHYHVTDVGIRLILESLCRGVRKYFGQATQYLWYSPTKYQGREQPAEIFSDQLANLIEDKALGYLTTSFGSIEKFEQDISERKQRKLDLIKQMIEQYETVIHIIQNPTLLKNPIETQANIRIASELLDQRYIQIWHIHDLLEDAPARQALRDHIKQVAGKKTEDYFGRNGCGLAWTTSPNIFYATINMKDGAALQAFLHSDLRHTIFYFPNPVDGEISIRHPVLKPSGVTLDNRIMAYCRSHHSDGYRYDPYANLIIAAEFARERKNTGEQILLLNMLNTLFERRGERFQLLVTLVPSTGRDAERINIFKEYIRMNQLPVVMGFGKQLIARGDDRQDDLFTMTDLWRHPRAFAAISTSVKEGFGLNFINPAIATIDNDYCLPTVGRRLKDIFPDFEAAGMIMDDRAFYDTLVIDETLVSTQGITSGEQKDRILKSRLPQKYETVSYDGVIPLGRDFSSYSADEQVLLMDVIDYCKLADRLSSFVEVIFKKDHLNRLAKKNAVAVMENLSLASYIEKLNVMIEKAFVMKADRVSKGETPTMVRDNTPLIDHYRQIEAFYFPLEIT